MKQAFTLIELVVTVFIIALMTAIGVPAFQQFGSAQELQQAADGVAAALQEAQTLALAPTGGADCFIVRFDFSNQFYYQYSSRPCGSNLVQLKQLRLPKAVRFQSLSPPGSDFTFPVSDPGRLALGVEQRISISHTAGGSKTIVVNGQTGLIQVQ